MVTAVLRQISASWTEKPLVSGMRTRRIAMEQIWKKSNKMKRKTAAGKIMRTRSWQVILTWYSSFIVCLLMTIADVVRSAILQAFQTENIARALAQAISPHLVAPPRPRGRPPAASRLTTPDRQSVASEVSPFLGDIEACKRAIRHVMDSTTVCFGRLVLIWRMYGRLFMSDFDKEHLDSSWQVLQFTASELDLSAVLYCSLLMRPSFFRVRSIWTL